MDLQKYLNLARQAKAENNSEDAKLYYNKVREEDPENGEAKYFYAYFSMYEGKLGELNVRFGNLCKILPSSITLIKNSSNSKEEILKSIEEVVNSFVPETWTLNRFMNKKNHEQKIGDSYVTVFNYSAIKSVCVTGMSALKNLGDQISTLYSNDPECEKIAAIAWKEYVSLCQKWYSYAPKGDAEIYAEKIKKVDPAYEMPKKAGCISFADKK